MLYIHSIKQARENMLYQRQNNWDVHRKVIAELSFDLPVSYKFHKQNSVDVQVNLICFTWNSNEYVLHYRD